MGKDFDQGAHRVSYLSSVPSICVELTLRITQDVFKHLYDNGLFRLETEDQTYCEDDKLFLADRFVEGVCPQCGYDVSLYSRTEVKLTSRTQEGISVINAPSPTLPLPNSFTHVVNETRTTESLCDHQPTHVSDST